MVEVFKTNVRDAHYATLLVEQIHNTFANYAANFDLEDCDNILRVECKEGTIKPSVIIDFLQSFGFIANVLPDEINLQYGY